METNNIEKTNTNTGGFDNKQYYQQNKEKWSTKYKERNNEKMQCECGRMVTRRKMVKHCKTEIHKRLMAGKAVLTTDTEIDKDNTNTPIVESPSEVLDRKVMDYLLTKSAEELKALFKAVVAVQIVRHVMTEGNNKEMDSGYKTEN